MDLCRQRGVELLEGHLMADRINMCLSVPPKYRIAFEIGFLNRSFPKVIAPLGGAPEPTRPRVETH